MNTQIASIFVAAALALSSTAAQADIDDNSSTRSYLNDAFSQQASSVTTELANATRYALQQTLAELKLAFSPADEAVELTALNTAVTTKNED
ncbi:hypothetical protein IDSA_10950 [Pseudidiomarina salinarum]|uniref:Uncharacterized protein n=1 Tax=Pseudidiomarina salinarum TaxID=435908 RepID=A0A094IWS5_9GAMM|nr:hypothetical protein [Pseudidiomarina salinarum]KFZ30264.1 hypothetical protein IDSA_10950 [Pseudidiomarina salinarum]RUO69965.1 hypothetical protein CWI79_00380 [Pseudidiomarina salinarum]